jgi:alanyl-tRNA synthetase
VDEAGYRAAEERARRIARGDREVEKFDKSGLALAEVTRALAPTRFVGYTESEAQAHVLALVVDGQPVQSASEGSRPT